MKRSHGVVRVPFSPIGEKVSPAFVLGADEGRLQRNAQPSPLPAGRPSPLYGERGTTTGFSLVESLVIVSMISVLSVMSLRAVPALRSHQELVADTEKIRALLLDAKQRTLNQIRPDDCMDTEPVDDPVRAACSDTGVALQYGEIIEFANTYRKGNGRPKYDTQDYVINRSKPVTRIQAGSPTSLLFKSTPPTLELYRDGRLVRAGDDSTKITLIATNGSKRTLTIYSSGTIDVDYE